MRDGKLSAAEAGKSRKGRTGLRQYPAWRRLNARWRRFTRRSRMRNSAVAKKVLDVKSRVADACQKAGQGVGFSVAFGTAIASSFMLFRVLNKTKVYGLENIPEEHENVLYCLNHCSLLDNFAFEAAAYVPKVIFKRKYIPVSLADRKNFFGDPSSRRLKDRVLTILGRHFFRHLKAYPVDRKRADMGQVERWRELLKENIVIVFPEGTRTRDGSVGRGKPGVGKLIYEARPIVMPVYMSGTAEILGVGMRVPAVFRTVRVYIGKPIDLDELIGKYDWNPDSKAQMMRNYVAVSDAIMEQIRRLNPQYSPPNPQ
ncbi:1-acyl-sn-glycerol-3-phosphate acyltransferase [bacterium]|nr:1-acyl-sn-glycerol-3-phosphate acyltransferase [bacterium]